MTNHREQIAEISPPWLREEVGGTILRAVGTVLDALGERTAQAAKLGFPQVGPPSSLGYIGNDREIERPPGQSEAGYALQLREAFDTWRSAGAAWRMLTQMRLFFTPANGPGMRAVAEGRGGIAIWHNINPVTGVVTRYEQTDNWNWKDLPDEHPLRQGWVVVDCVGYWTPDHWGDAGDWGDGGVWGSDMTEAEVQAFNGIMAKWKPQGTWAQIILIFDSSLFELTDPLAANVDGDGDSDLWRAAKAANFLMPQFG
jgi:hypothetical protein